MMLIGILSRAIEIYTVLLVVYALLSWFPGGYQTGFGRILSKVCEPYLGLFDHLNLSFGPVNFNIAFAIIVLQLASQAIVLLLQRLIQVLL
ncbi:MAG: YggT family protein [Enterococcus aquimarinus]